MMYFRVIPKKLPHFLADGVELGGGALSRCLGSEYFLSARPFFILPQLRNYTTSVNTGLNKYENKMISLSKSAPKDTITQEQNT